MFYSGGTTRAAEPSELFGCFFSCGGRNIPVVLATVKKIIPVVWRPSARSTKKFWWFDGAMPAAGGKFWGFLPQKC